MTSAGARCDKRVNTFCSRKISSQVEVVLFTTCITIFRMIDLAMTFESQLRVKTKRTRPIVLRKDAMPKLNPDWTNSSLSQVDGSLNDAIKLSQYIPWQKYINYQCPVIGYFQLIEIRLKKYSYEVLKSKTLRIIKKKSPDNKPGPESFLRHTLRQLFCQKNRIKQD
jgi:hypothetical protein